MVVENYLIGGSSKCSSSVFLSVRIGGQIRNGEIPIILNQAIPK